MIVKYLKANIHDAYGFKFIPGANDVPAKLWAEIKKDSEIQYFLENDVMVEMAPDQPKEQTKVQEAAGEEELIDLSGYSEKKAIELVKVTYSIAKLQLFQANETRPKVVKALHAQLLECKDKDSVLQMKK